MSDGEAGATTFEEGADVGRGAGPWRPLTAWRVPAVRIEHLAFVLVMLGSAALELRHISHNGYGNNYYSAAVKSMLGSLHNFFFVSADPGGLISVDKPPVGLWLQVLSAKLFGFRPLTLLLPEAACGLVAVAVTYRVVSPRFGRWPGVAAAAALAVFPAFVASTRDNNLDAALILLMLLAGWAMLRAIETDRLSILLLAAVLVGLAFNTKALAAYLVVPGMALAYLFCAQGSWRRRGVRLVGAGVLTGVLSLAWIVAVDAVPAHSRPWVGGTKNNSELSLTFGYNGFGRVAGEVGGPGQTFGPNGQLAIGTTLTNTGKVVKTGGKVSVIIAGSKGHKAVRVTPTQPAKIFGAHRAYNPITEGPSPGVFRLFGTGFGDQAGWLLPLAAFGGIALALLLLFRRSRPPDRRLAALLVFGGWFVVELFVLSSSDGIVHPYYTSALGPGTAIMVGAGGAAFLALARRDRRYLALPTLALITTVIVEIDLLHRQYHYLRWLWPVVVVVGLACIAAMWLRPRLLAWAVAVGVGAMLIVPALYSKTVWAVPTDGTFPAAGPYTDAGEGGVGASAPDLKTFTKLFPYVDEHSRPGARFVLLTQASITAAPMILLGQRAAAFGGYGTHDPAITPRALAKLVNEGQARYVLLGGAYAFRGGNPASHAVARACRVVAPHLWRYPVPSGGPHSVLVYPVGGLNLALYDCAGRTKQLAAD